MIKIFLILLTSFCGIIATQAQVIFYNSGTIQYERKINSYRMTEGSWLNKAFENSKFSTDTFVMQFDAENSIYKKLEKEEIEDESNMWFSISLAPDKSNIVYKDLKSDSVWAVRDLFEETIAIEDSMRRLEWKITGETREIAGFMCHKAVGIMNDSLYIVAFYTDQILPETGPETFGGLPGTIMGLAVPRLYTTWMAISFEPTPKTTINKPKSAVKKKDIYNWHTYNTAVSERFKEWGEPYTTLFVWMWGI